MGGRGGRRGERLLAVVDVTHSDDRLPTADELPPSRREQRGWYMYDWANSAFPTTVLTVFLGPYLSSVSKAAMLAKCGLTGADAETAHGVACLADGRLSFLGIPIYHASVFPYAVSLATVLQVITLPIAGAIADQSSRKRLMLAILAYLGAVATVALYFLSGTNWQWGVWMFLIANLAFGMSIVVYHSYLPEISTPDQRDRVSSVGWAVGYLGGGLLLVANLVFYSLAKGEEATTRAVRLSLASAGVWWALFTIIPLLTLRRRRPRLERPPLRGASVLTEPFRQLGRTLQGIRLLPQTLLFLVAYLLYNDGIQGVISLSAQFGAEELKLDQGILIQAILVVQFVAFGGALLLGKLAQRFGPVKVLMASLVLWSMVVLLGFVIPAGQPLWFFVMGSAIGLVMGGSQALSRSLFSHFIPPGKEGEYYGFYEISDKGTSWLSPLFFGLALHFTHSYRIAIVSLIVFFVFGLVLLARVRFREGIVEAGNSPPELL